MSGATVTTSQTKEVVDPQKTIDAIKKGSADNLNSGQNDAGNGEETATILNGSTIKINIDDYMGDNDEQETSQFDLDDDSFTDIKLEDHPHNLNLVLKGFDKEFVKNKEKVKEELRKLFTDTIKVDLPSVYSPEGKNNYVYIRAKTQEDKKKILAALAEPTPVLTYKIQAKPCLTNNFAYVVVDDSNKDEALDLIMKHRNISYRDQLLNKSNEARQLLKATLDKFDDEIKTRVEKLERKYQPPHANVEKIVPLVPTQHYARECDVRIEINPANNEIVSGIVVTDKKLSTVYLLPLKYCIHIAKPLIEAVEQFISYLKTTTQLRAYNRSTGEGDVIGLKVIMNRACEVMITVELVRKSELAYGFVPLDPKEAAVVSEVALFGKKAIQGKRIRMRKNRPGGPLSGAAKTSSPTKTDSTANAAAAAATTPTSAGGASETKPAEQAAATTEETAENDGEENKDDSKSPVKEDTSNLNQLIHLKACDDDSFDFKVTQAERTLLSAQVNNIKADLVQYYNQYKLRHGIVLVHISWVKVLGSHHFESAPFTHQIFKRGMLKDDYNGHTYDFNTVKNFVPRTVTFESLMRAVEDVVNFAKHPPENLALCTDYRYLMLYFAKKCKQLMVFHRWKCAEGTFRPQWWVKSGVRMSNSVTICFAQNNHGQVKEANKLFTAKGIPGTLITWGDMNLGIFARLVELGCKQVVMVFPKSNVFGSLGKYIKLAYPYLRLTRVITLDCQPGGELFSFVAVFQQATGAPPLKKIPGVTPGMAVASSPLKGKRPAPSGPPRPLVMDQGPQNKFPRRDFGPIGRPPMEGPPRGGNFGRDRYMDDRPPYGGPPRMVDHDPWMDNRGPPPYPSDRFERVGPPPSSYGPPPPEMVEPRSMGGGGGGGGRPSSAGGGPPAPDPNITSALNTLSVFMQSQLEFNKMLRTNIEKMSTVPSPSPAVAPPSLAASSTQASFPEPVAPPAPSLSRSRRDSPPPLMATKRAWAKDEPERETKRPFYGGGGSGGGRSYYDDGPSSGPADSFSGRRSGGTGSRPSTSDRVVRETRDSWDADVSPSKGWDSNPTTGGGGSGIGGGGGGRYGVEPASSVWGSRDEPTAAYTRDVRVKDEEPARPPRGGGGGGGFASDPRSSFGSLAAQRPAYTTPTSNWGASIARDRDSRPSGLGRNVGGSGGAGDRYGSSSDRFGSSGGGDRFGGGSNDRFGSTSDRFSGGGANRSGGSDRFGGSGGSISVDRYGGGGGGGSGGFGGGGNDDNRFGGGRSSWASGGGGSSGGRGFGNNSGEPRSSWGGSGGYNNSSSSFYK